jgi:hypothetical protein
MGIWGYGDMGIFFKVVIDDVFGKYIVGIVLLNIVRNIKSYKKFRKTRFASLIASPLVFFSVL